MLHLTLCSSLLLLLYCFYVFTFLNVKHIVLPCGWNVPYKYCCVAMCSCEWYCFSFQMWKSVAGHNVSMKVSAQADDWETDPDFEVLPCPKHSWVLSLWGCEASCSGSLFQNDVSEQEQRWGAKTIEGSGRGEHIRWEKQVRTAAAATGRGSKRGAQGVRQQVFLIWVVWWFKGGGDLNGALSQLTYVMKLNWGEMDEQDEKHVLTLHWKTSSGYWKLRSCTSQPSVSLWQLMELREWLQHW